MRRKRAASKVLYARVDADVHEILKAIAEKTQTSIADVAEQILKEGLGIGPLLSVKEALAIYKKDAA